MRSLFGGRIKQCVTGAAPISHEILEFFWACGVPVLEGYGHDRDLDRAPRSTGRTTSSSARSASRFRGCEIKIADDGEVLVKGPNIFRGYYKNEEATDETIVDGWLHTGDLGRLDEDGFLYITGRKKDIIITAGGKNITPANLENGLKQNQYISQAVVYGDRRPYLTALITLDPEEIVPWAQGARARDDRRGGAAKNERGRASWSRRRSTRSTRRSRASSRSRSSRSCPTT